MPDMLLTEGYSDGRMNRTEESFFAWEKWPMWRLYVSTALHAVQLGQLPMKWILPMRFVTDQCIGSGGSEYLGECAPWG